MLRGPTRVEASFKKWTTKGANTMRAPQRIDPRLAWLNNGRCCYEDALVAAQQGSDYPNDLGLASWSIVELVEAAVRSGRAAEATLAFQQLRRATQGNRSDFVAGIKARCEALLSDGDEAETHYLNAIESLDRTQVPVELGRAHLLYGEWLRRGGRRVEARHELRIAQEILSTMGLEDFADRARRELLATGETVRKRSVETFDTLTPQESQISRLASLGYTNSEIGMKLFLSDRTVEWHLRKVFTKLGIRSRRDLREVLPEVQEYAVHA
jgi:ATP/maltotriose-dependent transcriptional regulator MalT